MNPLHSGLLLFLLELLLLLELFLAGVFGNTIWIFCPALSAQSLPFRLFRGLLCGNSSLYFIFRVINFPVPDCEDGVLYNAEQALGQPVQRKRGRIRKADEQ